MDIGPLYDHGCRVLFGDTDLIVYSKDSTHLLTEYREQTGAKLWRFPLRPDHTVLLQRPTGPVALNANDLPSVVTLVKYLHAAAGFPVKSTWLAAIQAGNYASCLGLNSANASKYCPVPIETLQGHKKQSRQVVRSTKTTTPPEATAPSQPRPTTKNK